jgi:hypothetical protein
MRPHLLRAAQDQSEPGVCRPKGRLKQVSDRIWLVSFMDYDLGYFDDEKCRLEPLASPFGPKVLPMSPVRNMTHVIRMDPMDTGGGSVR